MEHKIIVKKYPNRFCPTRNMLPFNIVRQQNMNLTGFSGMSTVGIRYAGYFSYQGEGTEKEALSALKYGLMYGHMNLCSTTEIDFEPFYTTRLPELIDEANKVLREAESAFQLTEVVFGYVEYCIHDGSHGKKNQRYQGILIGQSASHQISVSKPSTEGQWQCICGAWNDPGKICADCGLAFPVFPNP